MLSAEPIKAKLKKMRKSTKMRPDCVTDGAAEAEEGNGDGTKILIASLATGQAGQRPSLGRMILFCHYFERIFDPEKKLVLTVLL